MLIQALCEYYNMLEQKGQVLPKEYSIANVHFLIALTPDGSIDEVVDYKVTETVGNRKKTHPAELVLPARVRVSRQICANIVEHRPAYLFGLELDEKGLTMTKKADQFHQAFVEKNLAFLEDLHSPVIDAYRAFIQNWDPQAETENVHLLGLGSAYKAAGFVFCVSGHPEALLHEDPQLKARWETWFHSQTKEPAPIRQCAITGMEQPIARVHGKIRGVIGGQASGTVLVGFNNDSEWSYGNAQSYNSNLSEPVADRYTYALNHLLASPSHRMRLGDVTVLYWAVDTHPVYEDLFQSLLFGPSDTMDAEQTEQLLDQLMKEAAAGTLTEDRIGALARIDPKTPFYMVGLKPNVSRLSVKFMVRDTYGDLLKQLIRFQSGLQMEPGSKPVPLWRIGKELVSPKSTDSFPDPGFTSRLMESILMGRPYPAALLKQLLFRVRIDTRNSRISPLRAGLFKAYLNQNIYKEEVYGMALDPANHSEAYLCGRLFAVLEKLQTDASFSSINRTIRDRYFAPASTKPAATFPKLIRLGQNYLNKCRYPVYYQKLIGEIIDGMDGTFPERLPLTQQAEFVMGYYHQNKKLWEKKPVNTDEKEMENE